MLLISTTLLSGCGKVDRSTIKIVNESSDEIVNVSINDNRTKWNIGNINPGKAVSFGINLQGEGDAAINWTNDGKNYRARFCYYGAGYPAIGTVHIKKSNVRFECHNMVP